MSMLKVSNKFYWKALAGMLLLSLLLYMQAVSLPFFSDDFQVMLRLSKGNPDTGIFLRPLGDFTLWLQYYAAGFNPFSYHLVNILLHGLCGFVVIRLAIELAGFTGMKENQLVWAVCSGLLFVCYPFHAETVIWVIGRGIILSTLMFLLALLYFLTWKNNEGARPGHLLLSLFFFSVALSGYETALALPFIIGILAWFRERDLSRVLKATLPYIGVCLLYIMLRYLLLPEVSGGGYFRTGNQLAFYLYNYAALVARSFTPPIAGREFFVGAGVIIAIVILLLLWRLRNKSRAGFSYAVLFFGLMIAALLPVVTVGISTVDHEGGRFLYQSSVFTVMFTSMLLTGNFFRTRLYMPVAAIAFTMSVVLLLNVVSQWKLAGVILKRSMQSLPVATGPSIVTGAPDKIGSAYFFRHGLREACFIYGKGEWMEGTDTIVQRPVAGAQAVRVYTYHDGKFVPL